jgi:hypothetical protein
MAYEYLTLFMLTVTLAGHRAVGAVAAARALSGLFVLYKTARGKEYGGSNKCYDQYVYPVCGKPVDHGITPLPSSLSWQVLQGGR